MKDTSEEDPFKDDPFEEKQKTPTISPDKQDILEGKPGKPQ